MKKIFSICILIVICLSLTSCDLSINSVDTLMRPPKLSGESSLLQMAFDDSIDNDDLVVMKNPISGDYRSSYLFIDLDNDSVDEAFVFYSEPEISSEASFSLFKKDNNKWTKVSNIKGRGEEIYEIDFADINGDKSLEIIISWTFLTDNEKVNSSFSNGYNRVLTVYSYQTNTITLVKSEYFTKMYVDDFNNDNFDEILLLNINLSNAANLTTARLLSFNSEYVIEKDISLNLSNMLDIHNIATDTVDGHTRIYIDGLINENALITDIIDINHQDFIVSLPFHSEDDADVPLSVRGLQFFSVDIDNDGVVEIPTNINMDNAVVISGDSDETLQLPLTIWSELKDNELIDDFKCLYNTSNKYMYIIPDEWDENVAITYNSDNFVLSFYEIDSEETTDNEIISFKVFDINEWSDYTGKYIKFSEDGVFVYTYLFNDRAKYSETDLLENFVIVN